MDREATKDFLTRLRLLNRAETEAIEKLHEALRTDADIEVLSRLNLALSQINESRREIITTLDSSDPDQSPPKFAEQDLRATTS